jgi:predicted metalloprotease with PDZ domain
VPDDGCLAYRVNVSRPIKLHDRTGEKVKRVGRDLLVSVGLWLWRPEKLAPDEDVQLAFDLPQGVAVSAPWKPSGSAPPTFRLGQAPHDWPATVAFGRFRERTLRIGGAQLRLSVLEGSPPADVEQVQTWLTEAAQMVADLYGRFPLAQAQLLVVPNARGAEPTPWAYVLRGGSPAVHFFINQRRPMQEFYDDWTATHELAHLLLPFVDHNDAWLSEGVATYYQNVLRARAGRLSEHEAWSRLHAGFRRGRDTAPGMTLAQATENMYRGGTFLRVYWEGAAMILLADVRLRQLTAGKQSMDTALAALHDCCLDSDRAWSAKELFARLDEITGTQVFSQLFDAHVASKDFPDLTGVYRQLGLQTAGDAVELVPGAPYQQLRQAIMNGGALYLSTGQ